MTALTKLDIAAIRQADAIVVCLYQREPDGKVRLIKHVERNENNPFAQSIEHNLPADVVISGYHGTGIKDGAVSCSAHADIYHPQITPLSSALRTLRVGDKLRFVFRPDAHTTQALCNAGIHGADRAEPLLGAAKTGGMSGPKAVKSPT